jgi:two-component system sensor histidine kinase SenX3
MRQECAETGEDAYPRGMDVLTTWPISALVGFSLGALLVGVVWLIRSPWSSSSRIHKDVVPDGLDTALEVIGATGLVLDHDNKVIRASRTALKLGLVEDREIAIEKVKDLIDRAKKKNKTVQQEFEFAGTDSDVIHILVRVAPLGSRFTLLVAEDRSDIYRIDNVRRDFIANISHELKTPIGAVSLLAEALSFSADDPAQVRKFAASLEKESHRLAELTGDIIELSRLQSLGTLESGEPVAIDDVVLSAVDANQVAAELAEVELVVQAHTGAYVFGDQNSLVTAVHNLIRNAINYSHGPARVGIGVVVRDGKVEISVTDQGVGIPANELGRIFERFYRGDPARTRQSGGTGLGLSIVKHVIQNHSGEVRVWSHPGRGSTFTIKLAVIDLEDSSAPTLTQPTVVATGPQKPARTKPAQFVATAPVEKKKTRSSAQRENA